MNLHRARAYARVTNILKELGPAKLRGPEQAQIRHVADTLLFCADIGSDATARAEFSGAEALCEHLVGSGRWSSKLAADLTDDLWACGPGPHAVHLRAA